MKKTPAKRPAVKAKKKVAASPKKKPAKASRGLTEAQFKKIALAFPGTSEGSSYGSPSILLLKKFFTRLRREDNSLVLYVGSIDERDMMLEAEPATFHITDHYKNYPTILARLDKLDTATLTTMLERRWRTLVPKKMLKDR
jgi:hypothetical protein